MRTSRRTRSGVPVSSWPCPREPSLTLLTSAHSSENNDADVETERVICEQLPSELPRHLHAQELRNHLLRRPFLDLVRSRVRLPGKALHGSRHPRSWPKWLRCPTTRHHAKQLTITYLLPWRIDVSALTALIRLQENVGHFSSKCSDRSCLNNCGKSQTNSGSQSFADKFSRTFERS